MTTKALTDVAAERERQINVKGWTSEHDDRHAPGEMAIAAACYIITGPDDRIPDAWPWAAEWWKPKGRRRNLVRAGALILAEIERLDRIADGGER